MIASIALLVCLTAATKNVPKEKAANGHKHMKHLEKALEWLGSTAAAGAFVTEAGRLIHNYAVKQQHYANYAELDTTNRNAFEEALATTTGEDAETTGADTAFDWNLYCEDEFKKYTDDECTACEIPADSGAADSGAADSGAADSGASSGSSDYYGSSGSSSSSGSGSSSGSASGSGSSSGSASGSGSSSGSASGSGSSSGSGSGSGSSGSSSGSSSSGSGGSGSGSAASGAGGARDLDSGATAWKYCQKMCAIKGCGTFKLEYNDETWKNVEKGLALTAAGSVATKFAVDVGQDATSWVQARVQAKREKTDKAEKMKAAKKKAAKEEAEKKKAAKTKASYSRKL